MKKNNYIGFIALFFGIISIGTALFQVVYGPIEKKPTINEIISNKTTELKEKISSKLKKQETTDLKKAEIKKFNKDQLLNYLVIITSFLSILFSIFSFIRREDARVYSSAVAISSGAMFFHYITVAFGTLLLFIYLRFITND